MRKVMVDDFLYNIDLIRKLLSFYGYCKENDYIDRFGVSEVSFKKEYGDLISFAEGNFNLYEVKSENGDTCLINDDIRIVMSVENDGNKVSVNSVLEVNREMNGNVDFCSLDELYGIPHIAGRYEILLTDEFIYENNKWAYISSGSNNVKIFYLDDDYTYDNGLSFVDYEKIYAEKNTILGIREDGSFEKKLKIK